MRLGKKLVLGIVGMVFIVGMFVVFVPTQAGVLEAIWQFFATSPISIASAEQSSGGAKFCISGFCVDGWGSESLQESPGGRICINGKCVAFGPNDGYWSTTNYGACSATCEGGTQSAQCVPPRRGGKDCQGSAPTRVCNQQQCPDSDGDGYKDKYDNCPNQGTCYSCQSNGTCPQTYTGSYLYSYSSCVVTSGGCIDTDGDTLADASDTCPKNAQGSNGLSGCPKPRAYGPSVSGARLGSTSFSDACGSWNDMWQIKFGVENYKSYTVKYTDNNEVIISESCSGSVCTNGYDNVAGYSNRPKSLSLDKSRKVRIDVISASNQTDTQYSQCILASSYENFDSWNIGDINKVGGNTCDSNAVDAYTCNGSEERTCNDVKGCWWGTDDRWRYGGDNRNTRAGRP